MNCPPVSLPLLFKLWQSKKRNDQIAVELGCARGTLANLVRKHKLPKRPQSLDAPRHSVYPDPTPSEIEERAAYIRSTWSETERQSRLASAYRTVRAQVVVFDDTRDSYHDEIFAD